MDNNFDENMAADRENGGSQTANEVPADTERQQGLRDLQDTVTASYVPDASPENTNGIADTEQNAQPAADSDIQPVWSASAIPEGTSGFQGAQNIQNGQTDSDLSLIHI